MKRMRVCEWSVRIFWLCELLLPFIRAGGGCAFSRPIYTRRHEVKIRQIVSALALIRIESLHRDPLYSHLVRCVFCCYFFFLSLSIVGSSSSGWVYPTNFVLGFLQKKTTRFLNRQVVKSLLFFFGFCLFFLFSLIVNLIPFYLGGWGSFCAQCVCVCVLLACVSCHLKRSSNEISFVKVRFTY